MRSAPATIDGVATDHYAFREADVDWEVWIQKGDQPLPRKLVDCRSHRSGAADFHVTS